MANSKIYLGSTNIGSLFQGADDISIYLGENKVYPLAEPPMRGDIRNTYNITDTTQPTQIIGFDGDYGVVAFTPTQMWVDGVEVTPSSAYTFSTTGEHIVEFELGDGVTTLPQYAFWWLDYLTSTIIGDEITSIDYDAFSYCSGLTSVTIGSGVTSVNGYTFYNNYDCLTSITVDSNNATFDSRNNCNAIINTNTNELVLGCKNTIIPNNVTSIGDYAFHQCYGLTSVDIPSGVTSIGSCAFQECSGLTSIVIPSGVTEIKSFAFESGTSLTSITVEATTPPTAYYGMFDGSTCPIYVPCESVEAYKSASGWSDYASRIACPPFEGKFQATYSGGETYELDCDGNTTLSTGNTKPSGYQASAMTEAIIGDCVTEIGEHAFYGYSGLTSVSIPDSVTTIGIAPFQNCYSLTSVTIPSGVTFIGNQAFVQCTGLTSVTCLATTPPTLDQRAFNTGNSCPIYVPSASVNAYKTATVWSGYASRIQAIP